VSAGEALIGPVEPPEISIMTFNVLRAGKASAGWKRRRDRVTALLRRERPTILGAQEVLPHQVEVLRDALGDAYRFVGHGRDADGGGEGCPIFYDARRLELLDAEQTALSTRPGTPGSRSWGTLFPRVLTRAELRDRVTGVGMVALNTHLDVLSPLARRRAAEIIAERAGTGPAVVTGDFNAGPDSTARRILVASGLADSWAVAGEYLTREWSTYARRRRPRSGGRRIDAIHVRGGDVLRVGIDARPVRGGWASDHFAVQAVIRVRENHA
jgi:endonuclease/exonuclease/phosphatase family metal-dependent hydrolase